MKRILTQGQKNLLRELYAHQVIKRKTMGSFRDRYMEGCQQKQWGIEETERLEGVGLVKISLELALAGIMCIGITHSGRKYQERYN
jgi:hypothetical protein